MHAVMIWGHGRGKERVSVPPVSKKEGEKVSFVILDTLPPHKAFNNSDKLAYFLAMEVIE